MPVQGPKYIDEIQLARERLASHLSPTPLIRSEYLTSRLGHAVWLKAETQQPTGSFKVRPAFNSMLANEARAREAGVVTSSSGNFAQAVAFAATKLSIDAQIVMMEGASEFKRERTRQFGGNVVLCDNTFDARWETTFRIQRESGRLLVHPYDSAETIAGDGTLGLELATQFPEMFTVLVPISGGGLISGIASALKAVRPECRIVGVQPEANPSMKVSFENGERVGVQPGKSLADALSVAMPGESTFAVVKQLVDSVVLVSETEIQRAVRLLALEQKLIVEPGGAVSVAALLGGAVGSEGGPVVCVLSGGNVHPTVLTAILAGDEQASSASTDTFQN